MKVKIKKGDIFPIGEYQLTNRNKLARAKIKAGLVASQRDILIAYDKLAGRIIDPSGDVLDPQSLWVLETNQKLVDMIVKENELKRNSEYGAFILQTNEVQRFLRFQILSRSPNPNDKLSGKLERLTMGPLIDAFRICSHAIPEEEKIIEKLDEYKEYRNALAHKMFTNKRLTSSNCNLAIKKGEQIIKYLKENMQDRLKKLSIKKTDQISEFPKKFNELVKVVKSLESKVQKLENKKKK